MAGIFKRKHRHNFTTVGNGFINDEGLSAKAKGILLYLLSKPYDWQVYESDIVKHMADGRHSIRNGIRELELRGHIQKLRRFKPNGQFDGLDYEVSEEPEFYDDSKDGVDAIADLAAHELREDARVH